MDKDALTLTSWAPTDAFVMLVLFICCFSCHLFQFITRKQRNILCKTVIPYTFVKKEQITEIGSQIYKYPQIFFVFHETSVVQVYTLLH